MSGKPGAAAPPHLPREQRRRAAVIVVGDLARSPRMCLHALAFAAEGFAVDIFACIDTPVGDELANDDSVGVHALPSTAAANGSRAGRFGLAIRTAVAQMATLSRDLLRSRRAEVVIVQNPPALHILPILLAVCWWRGSRLIVDWHNFGWTILASRLGTANPAVILAGWLERTLASRAALHVCVSESMRHWLSLHLGVRAVVLRDRPAARFVVLAGEDRLRLRRDVLEKLDLPDDERRALGEGRNRLVVSSTSWSRDEDFALLLDALALWSRQSDTARRPHLTVVVSGSGPMRAEYEQRARASAMTGTSLHTVWLAEEDYPRLLAAADLGVCLHRSTSGVDLPMKLADMLGVGLPICVLDYGPCLREVVRDCENCVLFRDANELMRAWWNLFVDSPNQLTALRERIAAEPLQAWPDHWRERMLPLLTDSPVHRPAERTR